MSFERVRARLSERRRQIALGDQQMLEAEDWPSIRALLSADAARYERQMAKMLAKLAVLQDEDDCSDADDDESSGAEAGQGANGDTTRPRGSGVDGCGTDGCGTDGCGTDGCGTERGSSALNTGSTGAGGSSDPEPNKRKGHGRNGAGAYANAKHCFHALLAGVLGGLCQACGVGSMAGYREKLIVLVKGQPLFDATVHHFEQARCRLCGAIIRAEVPDVIIAGLGSSYVTYDWSACAMLLVMHYFAGVPFKRMESLQAGWGIPMPDANQWTLADQSADLLVPLYKALEKHGVDNALALRIDDTGSMIIEVRQKIRAELAAREALGESTKDVRTGINATGVYLETEQGKVLLFFTGLHHAGEIIDRILAHRQATKHRGKLVKVSDATSKNFSHVHQDELEEAVCNAHAFLKFRGVKAAHPEEYSLAGEVYKTVFDNDDAAKAAGMSPRQRLLYHREHSLPQMKRLKQMCREKLESKLVEPNSPLWEPLTFIINQWERLTKFCVVPGVPLDTNVVEQMLIIPVRYLAGSFNYRTQNGADVGDRHMSLIATANANGIEPVAYLTECLSNHEDLKRRPEHYLPWVYRARLSASDEPMATSRRSGASSQAVEHPLRPGAYRRPQGAQGPPATMPAPS